MKKQNKNQRRARVDRAVDRSRKRLWEMVGVEEAEMSESSDEDEDGGERAAESSDEDEDGGERAAESSDEDEDGGERAAAEAVAAEAEAGVAAAAEAAEAADASDVDVASSYDDSTESLFGLEDENGEDLDWGSVERDGNRDAGDDQQDGWPVGFMSERESDGLL